MRTEPWQDHEPTSRKSAHQPLKLVRREGGGGRAFTDWHDNVSVDLRNGWQDKARRDHRVNKAAASAIDSVGVTLCRSGRFLDWNAKLVVFRDSQRCAPMPRIRCALIMKHSR